MADVLVAPHLVAQRLTSKSHETGVMSARGWQDPATRETTLHITLAPLPQARGHRPERVVLHARQPSLWAVHPVGKGPRTWRHRFPDGPLCLQHPADDDRLLWLWQDGLDALLLKVRVHLASEEEFRRTRRWPGPELPHGHPGRDNPFPAIYPDTMKALHTRWRR